MKKGLRRQIKQDELVTWFERTREWLATHRDEARITVGVLIVVAAIGGGLGYVKAKQRGEAAADLAAALETFHAPVAAELQAGADPPAGSAYATREEKYKKAAAAFDGIERRYGSLAAARRARYYGALSRVQLGEYAEAEKALRETAAQTEGLEPALARLALADLHRRNGKIDEAAQAYRDFAADSGAPLPRDYALMSLARLLEEARKLAEAEATYRRIVEEFPTGVYAAEARQRLAYLKTALPG